MVDDLGALVGKLTKASGGGDRRAHLQALAKWLEGLSETDEKAIRRRWLKMPESRQRELHRGLCEVGVPFGPARRLLSGILEDRNAWADSLPEPPPAGPPGRSEEEWTAIFVQSGLPAGEAAKFAATLAPRDPDQLLREFYLAHGAAPETAESLVVKDRRNRKWVAATQAMARPEQGAKAREREDGMRAILPEIARHADSVAKELAALLLQPSGAAGLRDGAVSPLLGAIERAILAGQPTAPQAGGMRIVAGRASDEVLWRWHEVSMGAGDLADSIAEGAAPDPESIARTARASATIAQDARDLAAKLGRERGRPAKDALDAAEALRIRGVSWAQIATLLDSRGLWLNPHTPDNIRKSVQARRRRGRRPPATK